MLKKTLVLAMLAGAALASVAHAGQSVVSRDLVRAEATAANKAGSIPHGEATYETTGAVSSRSRTDVRAETVAANTAGQLRGGEALYAEGSVVVSAKSRADVKAELAGYILSGQRNRDVQLLYSGD